MPQDQANPGEARCIDGQDEERIGGADLPKDGNDLVVEKEQQRCQPPGQAERDGKKEEERFAPHRLSGCREGLFISGTCIHGFFEVLVLIRIALKDIC